MSTAVLHLGVASRWCFLLSELLSCIMHLMVPSLATLALKANYAEDAQLCLGASYWDRDSSYGFRVESQARKS